MSRLRARLARRPPGYRFTLGRVLAIYTGLMLVTVLAALDQTIVATATPSVVSDIGGLSQYSWVFTAYMLASAVTIPLYGKLGDLYGRKRVLLISIAIFLAGSALCGIATSMPMLIAFRALQGIGAGGLIPMSTATIASMVPLRERGKFDGFIGLGYAAGSIAGPLAGGLLVDHASWRWIFYVNIPFGLLALGVILATLVETAERQPHKLDWQGAAALGTFSGALLLGLVWAGRDYSWTSGHVLTALGISVLAAGLFAGIERSAAEPVLPLGLLRSGPIAASVACIAFGGFAMFGAIAYLPLFVQGAMGISATLSGFALIPMMLGHSIASMLTGVWISRTGRVRPNAIAGPIVLAIGTFLLWRLTVGSSVGEAARDIVIAGLGIGLMNQVFLLTIQNSAPRRLLGTASALVQFSRVIGGSIGVAVLGTIVNRGLPPGSRLGDSASLGHGLRLTLASRHALANALRPAFVTMTGAALVVLVVAIAGIRELSLARSAVDEPTDKSVDFSRSTQ